MSDPAANDLPNFVAVLLGLDTDAAHVAAAEANADAPG